MKAISESMMEIYEASALEEKDMESILCRPRIDFTSILDLVSTHKEIALFGTFDMVKLVI